MGSRLKKSLALLPGALLWLSACDRSPLEPEISDWEIVQHVVSDYLLSGPTVTIDPASVYEDLTGPRTLTIVSVRDTDDFHFGHIEGAINMPWRTVTNAANLASLPGPGSPLVIYCYTGHTGGLAATALSLLGFTAWNMKWGMMNWSDDPVIVDRTIWSESASLQAATETTANTITQTFNPPVLEVSSSEDPMTVTAAAIDRWITDTGWTPAISARAVYDNLYDGDTSNDPVIISVRSPEDYAAGHLPGAVNIPWLEIGDLDKLAMLDPDAEIVVYCYTGHKAGVATAILNTLGYRARNMKFGMMGWNTSPDVLNRSVFSGAPGYPTVATGGAP